MRWDDDGGPCGPASDGPIFRYVDPPHANPSASGATRPDSKRIPRQLTDADASGGEDASWRTRIELISLPFSEYSATVPERLDALRQRLNSEPAPGVRFVIVDSTRVTRPGGALLGVLHSAAGQLRRSNRCLILAGDLCGLVSVSRLGDLCHIAPNREAAFQWCREQLCPQTLRSS